MASLHEAVISVCFISKSLGGTWAVLSIIFRFSDDGEILSERFACAARN